MTLEEKLALINDTLENGKAHDLQTLDVAKICSFADAMVIATGTSTTHVKALGEAVAQKFKEIEEPPLGVEAGPEPDWLLVDLGDVVVHVMTEAARAHYALEKLWSVAPSSAEKA